MSRVQSYQFRNKIWFFATVCLNLLFFMLLAIINPYRLLPFSITILGINDIKPKLYDYQRYVKLFDIAHQKPKTVLLGSSRILWGIDPNNNILQQKGYTPVYNAGVLGPPMYEIKKYFDHALISQPHLKRVILGVDFYAFNQAFDGRTLILEKSFGKNTNELLKIHTKLAYDLKAALQTLKSSLLRKQTKSLREDGRLTPAPLEARELYKDFFHPQTQPMQKNMKNVLYGDFKLSEIDMDAFRYIAETCAKRHIELYIFLTPPYNGSEIVAFHRMGIWQTYQSFLMKLAAIHPYWDFVGWNKVTMNKENYVDGSHFIFPVGNLILQKIFGVNDITIPHHFGRYITVANVGRHVRDLEIEYQQSQNR